MTTKVDLLNQNYNIIHEIRTSSTNVNPEVRTLLFRLADMIRDTIKKLPNDPPARDGLHFNAEEYLKTLYSPKIEVTYAANGKIHSLRVME